MRSGDGSGLAREHPRCHQGLGVAAADEARQAGRNVAAILDVASSLGAWPSQQQRRCPVTALRGEQVLDRETQRLGRLNSFSGLVRWRNALVQANSLQNGAYGCGLGSMANELADTDEQARVSLAELFRSWEELLAGGLRRMQEKSTLQPEADPGQLAVGLMAALQGGYLLANTAHDVRPMEIALDLALEQVKTYLIPATKEV